MNEIVKPLTDSLNILGIAISGNESFFVSNADVTYSVKLYLAISAGVGFVMVFGEDFKNRFITDLLPHSGKLFHLLVGFGVCVILLTGLHHYYLHQSNLTGG